MTSAEERCIKTADVIGRIKAWLYDSDETAEVRLEKIRRLLPDE